MPAGGLALFQLVSLEVHEGVGRTDEHITTTHTQTSPQPLGHRSPYCPFCAFRALLSSDQAILKPCQATELCLFHVSLGTTLNNFLIHLASAHRKQGSLLASVTGSSLNLK